MAFRARVTCFLSSPTFRAGRRFRPGDLIPDDFGPAAMSKESVEEFDDGIPTEAAKPEEPEPMSLGQLAKQGASADEDGTLPGRAFKKPVAKRASDKSIV